MRLVVDDAIDAPQIRPTYENVCRVRPPTHMAKEMGEGLGSGSLLLKALQQQEMKRRLGVEEEN